MTTDQILHSSDIDMCHPCTDDDTTGTDNTTNDSDAHACLLVQNVESQSDAGANRHLTNMKHAMTNCKAMTPFTIGTMAESSTTSATGKGFTATQTTDPDHPLAYETLCSPKASGSVFSPEKHASDNSHRMKTWSQFGCEQGVGAIVFCDHTDTAIIKIPLSRKNGLWCMKTTKPK